LVILLIVFYLSFYELGISFAISQNGGIIMKGGIGLADVENNIGMTNTTVLRIASISKSLTTVAVGMRN